LQKQEEALKSANGVHATTEMELLAKKEELERTQASLHDKQSSYDDMRREHNEQIEAINNKWKGHTDQLQETISAMKEAHESNNELAQERIAVITEQLSVAQRELREVNESSQTEKCRLLERHAESDAELRNLLRRSEQQCRDAQSMERSTREEMMQLKMQIQNEQNKTTTQFEVHEMKVRELNTRLINTTQKLDRKRKRCDELETAVQHRDHMATKLQWIEKQQEDTLGKLALSQQERESTLKDLQRLQERTRHELTEKDIEIKTKEALCTSLTSKYEMMRDRVQKLQSQMNRGM
jgi:NADH:ubiquinone oxidoreductase subunit E